MFVSLVDVQESCKCTQTHSTVRGSTVCVLLVQDLTTVRVEWCAGSLAVQLMEQVQQEGILTLAANDIFFHSMTLLIKIFIFTICMCTHFRSPNHLIGTGHLVATCEVSLAKQDSHFSPGFLPAIASDHSSMKHKLEHFTRIANFLCSI